MPPRTPSAPRGRSPWRGWARTARRCAPCGSPSSSAMTSLMRASVPTSRPFMRETTTAVAGMSGRQAGSCALRVWAGTAMTTRLLPASTASTSVDADTFDGSRVSPRYRELRCSAVISSATSARRDQSMTGVPAAASARTFAKVVPQLPEPSTAIFAGGAVLGLPVMTVLRAAMHPGRRPGSRPGGRDPSAVSAPDPSAPRAAARPAVRRAGR